MEFVCLSLNDFVLYLMNIFQCSYVKSFVLIAVFTVAHECEKNVFQHIWAVSFIL